MKRILAALVIGCSIAAAEDFKTTAGKEFKGVTVSRVEPDGLVLTTDDGVTKVLFRDLPADVQRRYGFDAKATAKPKPTAEPECLHAYLTIYHIIDANAFLCEGRYLTPGGAGATDFKGYVIVYGATKGLADGDSLELPLFGVGTRKYVGMTVRTFATKPDEARRLIDSGRDQ